jgi:hypothetical protein
MVGSGKSMGLAVALLTLSAACDAAYCQYRDVVRTAAYNSADSVRAPILPVDDEQASAAGGPAINSQTARPGASPPAAAQAMPAPADSKPAYTSAPAADASSVQPPAETIGAAPLPTITTTPPAFNPAAVAPLPVMQPVPYYSGLFDQALCAPPVCLLEQPGLKTGWLFSAGTGLVKPYIHSTQSSAGLNFSGGPPTFAGTVHLPVAQPNWASMPDFMLGYRFEAGLGELRANVQFLNAQGAGTATGGDFGGPQVLNSRLNLDVVDFQYVNSEALPVRLPWISPAFMIPGRLGLGVHQENQPTYPPILFTYFVGARVASAFYDTTAVSAMLAERAMNNFSGAGPEVGLQLQTPTRWQALTIHSKLLATGLLGKTDQSFSAASPLPGIGSGVASARGSDGVATLNIELGLSYVPAWRQGLCRFTTGYKLQQWWFLGQTSNSVGELTLQGLFFRGELGF